MGELPPLSQYYIPILHQDFKFRLLFMFAIISSVGCLCVSLIRMKKTIRQLQNGGSTLKEKYTALCRWLETIVAILFLVMDMIYLALTYRSFIPSTSFNIAAAHITSISVHLEPILSQGMTILLIYQWFPNLFQRPWKLAVPLIFLNLAPYILILVYFINNEIFLNVQWVSFIMVSLINLFTIIIFRFTLYWITSCYPVMAFNEENSYNIQQKVLILYMLGFLDCAIYLLVLSQPFVLNIVVALFLTHIKLVLSLGLSNKLESIKRPIVSPELASLIRGNPMVEPGLVQAPSMSRNLASSMRRTRTLSAKVAPILHSNLGTTIEEELRIQTPTSATESDKLLVRSEENLFIDGSIAEESAPNVR